MFLAFLQREILTICQTGVVIKTAKNVKMSTLKESVLCVMQQDQNRLVNNQA